CGRKIAGGGRRWHRRKAAAARGMKPQAAKRADRRLDALQERESGGLMARELFLAQLLDYATESDDRLIRFVQHLPQRRGIAPWLARARHARGPPHHLHIAIA